MQVKYSDRHDYLIELLNQHVGTKCLVFVWQRLNVDLVFSNLTHLGYPANAIHGGRLLHERQQALKDFESMKAPILIADHNAVIGLNIPDIEVLVPTTLLPSLYSPNTT